MAQKTAHQNPMGTDGFEFVEYTAPDPQLLRNLFERLGFPVVATSGNLSEEPICFDEAEAVKRLSSVADLFLTHNRPSFRPVDDSIAQVVLSRPQLLRQKGRIGIDHLPGEDLVADDDQRRRGIPRHVGCYAVRLLGCYAVRGRSSEHPDSVIHPTANSPPLFS